MKNSLIKKILILSLFAIIIPAFVDAQTLPKIMPDCGPLNNCGYRDLMQLVVNIIDWIIIISVPVAAGVFAWAGLVYMTTGVTGKKETAKKMLAKVFIGFVFILAAWIIVTTITNTLLADPSIVPIQGATGVTP